MIKIAKAFGLLMIIFMSQVAFAQEETAVACSVSLETGYPQVVGQCSSQELIDLFLSLSSQLGISPASNPAVPLPVMVNQAEGINQIFYPGADELLLGLVSAIKPLDPELWPVPFNVDMNGYSSHNGYWFDQGQPLNCGSGTGCSVKIPGGSYYAISGDNQISKLGYQCTMAETEVSRTGCVTIILNQAATEGTFTVGTSAAYSWGGVYFNGNNLVDDTEPVAIELEPAQPALSLALWALASNLTYMMTTEPGNCGQPSGCDAVMVTIFVTSETTPLARVDMKYMKSE